MNRRQALFAASAPFAAASALSAQAGVPVLDTHIHLFDPTRPQGIPWPPKDSPFYKKTLPADYAKVARPQGVVGAIELECSPLLEDNQWVLDVIEKDKLMVGTVGNLEPEKPEFRKQLDRFAKNKLFLGIRCGNIWGRDLAEDIKKPEFVPGLKALAAAGLTLDSANPNAKLLDALLRVSDAVPTLRVVIDHLPNAKPSVAALEKQIRQFGPRKQVYVKLSAVLQKVDGKVNRDVGAYRGTLDTLFGVFGEDRVLYGSDWPNSEPLGPYEHIYAEVRDYFAGKPLAVREKYFYKNSQAAYRWVKRA